VGVTTTRRLAKELAQQSASDLAGEATANASADTIILDSLEIAEQAGEGVKKRTEIIDTHGLSIAS
jgi:hypothetical protein